MGIQMQQGVRRTGVFSQSGVTPGTELSIQREGLQRIVSALERQR
jgi:hypothetical protein